MYSLLRSLVPRPSGGRPGNEAIYSAAHVLWIAQNAGGSSADYQEVGSSRFELEHTNIGTVCTCSVGVIARARVSVSYLDWLVLSKASATSTR